MVHGWVGARAHGPRSRGRPADHNPSLFQWGILNQEDDVKLVDAEVVSAALSDGNKMCQFVHCVLLHVVDTAHGDVRWSLVPGYWALLGAVLSYLLVRTSARTRGAA